MSLLSKGNNVRWFQCDDMALIDIDVEFISALLVMYSQCVTHHAAISCCWGWCHVGLNIAQSRTPRYREPHVWLWRRRSREFPAWMVSLKDVTTSIRSITWYQHSYVVHAYSISLNGMNCIYAILYRNINLLLQLWVILRHIWLCCFLVKLSLPLLPGQEVTWQTAWFLKSKQANLCAGVLC